MMDLEKNVKELEERCTELEIRVAFQDDFIEQLNQTLAKMQDALDLQQGQLRLLYQKVQNHQTDDTKPYSLAEEIPPHY